MKIKDDVIEERTKVEYGGTCRKEKCCDFRFGSNGDMLKIRLCYVKNMDTASITMNFHFKSYLSVSKNKSS